MAENVKNIVPRKLAENAQTTQYTVATGKTVIDSATVTNVSASNVSFSCNLPAASVATGDGNLVIKARAIAPNETYLCPELVGQVLEKGGIISTLASAASALCISVNGREIT